MDYVVSISSSQENINSNELGGKGNSLVLLTKNGFNVPSGMIITTEAFEEIAKTRQKNSITHLALPNWLKRNLSKLWNNYFTGKSVVVRSSANLEDNKDFSFAGQFKSILNVNSFDKFLEAVEEVYNSLFSKTIIEYCDAHSIKHSELKMAIVVQEFIKGEFSGVLFTKDPITGNDSTIIEVVIGLNQGLVSGVITPTKFIVDNRSLRKLKTEKRIQDNKVVVNNGSIQIKRNNINITDIFSSDSIKNLVKIGLKIEALFGKPQDIEWTMSKGEIYILQSRGITTANSPYITRKKLGRAFRGYPASPGFVIGIAKIIDSDSGAFNTNGLILVTEHTDMLPYMKSAKAIITEEGGTLSHAAIVSMELGIPCVVGVKNAKKRIKDGTMIGVDGNNGFVYTSMALPEHVFEDQKLDETRLYCFDKMKAVKCGKTVFYYEKFKENIVYYTITRISKRTVRNQLHRFGVNPKFLIEGNRDKAALTNRYYLTLKDPQERYLYVSSINTASHFDSALLDNEIQRIIAYAKIKSRMLKVKDWRTIHDLLTTLLAAYRAFSAYILINTMICEGYGYRNLYYNLAKIQKKHKIDYLRLLYNIDREEKIDKITDLTHAEKITLIKAMKYYKVLKTWRKDSYPIFKEIGITNDSIRQILSELTTKLNSTTGRNLSHQEWFIIAVKKTH